MLVRMLRQTSKKPNPSGFAKFMTVDAVNGQAHVGDARAGTNSACSGSRKPTKTEFLSRVERNASTTCRQQQSAMSLISGQPMFECQRSDLVVSH
jgi:hypothetical protein